MSLVDYLEINSMGKNGNSAHEALLEEFISRMQHFLGIRPESASIFREVKLINHGIEVGRVDRIALLEDEIYLIEGKVMYGTARRTLHRVRKELNEQLNFAHTFFLENYGISGHKIAVYRKTRTKKICHYRAGTRNLNVLFEDGF